MNKNLYCISGGADGGDRIFGQLFGAHCTHIVVQDEKNYGDCKVYVATEADYSKSANLYKEVCANLGRRQAKNEFTLKLVTRDMMQIVSPKTGKAVDFVLAISNGLAKSKLGLFVKGGSAYACACAVKFNIPLMVIDISGEKFKLLKWDYDKHMFVKGSIKELQQFIMKYNLMTGIGTRDIDYDIRRRLMDNLFKVFKEA